MVNPTEATGADLTNELDTAAVTESVKTYMMDPNLCSIFPIKHQTVRKCFKDI